MKKLYRVYVSSLMLLLMLSLVTMPAFAADDMWTVAMFTTRSQASAQC